MRECFVDAMCPLKLCLAHYLLDSGAGATRPAVYERSVGRDSKIKKNE